MEQVFINSLNDTLNKVNSIVQDHKACFIIDANVYKLYQEYFKGYSYKFIVEATEENKNLDTVKTIYDYLLTNEFNRSDYVIACGGGIITDTVGYVSISYKRGINYISIPSTTLAMADATIGNKCGINYSVNSQLVKNMIGGFTKPIANLICFELLMTLPQTIYNEGMVEVIKIGLTNNKQLFELVKNEGSIEDILTLAINTKMDVVNHDLYDQNYRHVLNFGHSLAHAMEINHGVSHAQAVSFGIIQTIENETIKEEVIKLFDKLNINYKLRITKEDLDLIKYDKNREHDYLDIVILDDYEKYHYKRINMKDLEHELI